MRLHFVSHSLPPADRPLSNLGGMQRVAMELDAALSTRGDIRYSTRFLRASWKTVHLRAVPFLLATLVSLWRLARRREIDVVLFSSMVTASLAVLLRKSFRRHGIVTAAIVHGLDVTTPSSLYQWFVPRVFGSLDLVMPVSAATGEQCVQRGLDPDKLRPVRNGVDLDRFEVPLATRADRRSELGVFPEASDLGPGAVVLCSVGRQVRRKGFAWFVQEVMPLLPSSYHYWLAGDGPEIESIRAAISSVGMERRVVLLGRVSEEQLRSLYRGADLFVMPNIPVPGDMEGFGVVILEAGLNGLPTVGARLEGIAEVIVDGENGALISSGDASGFAGAIREFTDSPLSNEVASRRASAYTRAHFSWQAVASDYLETIRAFAPA